MVISSIFNEKTIYLHTAWANDESGSGFSLEEFDGAVFIGNYTSSSATESGNFASYSWKRIDNIEDPDETIEDEDLEDDTEDDEEFIEDEEDDDDGTYLDEDLEEDLIEIEAAAVRSGDNITSNQQANDSGIGNVNLLYGTNSGKSGYSVSGGFVLSDLGTTIYDDAEEVKAVRITCDTASDTAYLSFGSDYLLDNLSEMSAGDVFTLSFDSRMSVLFVSETLAVQGIDGAKRMLLFDQSLDNTSDNEEIDNTGEWVHYSAQAVYEEQETSEQVFCISLKNMPAGATLDIANLKIEEGSLETPWRQSEDEIAEIARQAQDTANAAVSDVDVEYYLSTSSTSLSGGSWSTTAPEWVDGRYMWSRTVKTDGAGNKTYSPSQNGVCIAGAKGATGAKGDKGEPGADGANGTNGTDGRGVSSIIEQYYKSTSATSLSDGSWSETYPGWTDGTYIWTRSVINYTTGNPTTTDPICVTGSKGDTGATGPQGNPGKDGVDGKDGTNGKDGTDGRSVKSVTRYYILATTKPSTPSTSWTTTEPAFDEMEDTTSTLYFADLTTFSDNSTAWSSVSVSSSYEAAKTAYEEAKAARERLVSWCSENNQTLIDGAKIYTESIGAVQIAAGAVIAEKIASGAITTDKLAAKAVTANKINAADLFAQDITATGTIRGVNLVGAKGSFSEELRVFSGTENSAYRMGLKAGADSFKVGWWNKDDEYDALTSYLGITKSGAININNGVSGISLYAKSNIALETGAGTTIISGSGCGIEAVMRHSLEFENNKRIGFQTSTGASSRGIGLSASDNLLFGSGDSGLTNGMYFYVGAKDSFCVYGGSTKDVRFRSFKADDGSMYIQAPDVYNRTTSSGSNVRVNSNGTLYRYSSSSMRYKKDITTKLGDELDPERLYDLKIWQYKYREGHLDKNDQRYGQDIIGFIAEDVKQKYPIAVNYNEDGQIENWNVEMIVPAMLKLIQNQKKEIDELKERLTDGEKDEDKRKSGSCTDKSVPDRNQRRGHHDHGRLHKGAGGRLTGACKAGRKDS